MLGCGFESYDLAVVTVARSLAKLSRRTDCFPGYVATFVRLMKSSPGPKDNGERIVGSVRAPIRVGYNAKWEALYGGPVNDKLFPLELLLFIYVCSSFCISLSDSFFLFSLMLLKSPNEKLGTSSPPKNKHFALRSCATQS